MARDPQESTGQGVPTTQEFITKTTEELQDARAIRGDSRTGGAAPHPGEDAGLRVCIDVPGLNRAASQERFWPSRVGRCEDPPHSYVRMPFGLPSVALAYQRNVQQVQAAQEARFHAVLEEVGTVFRKHPEPLEPPEAQGPGDS